MAGNSYSLGYQTRYGLEEIDKSISELYPNEHSEFSRNDVNSIAHALASAWITMRFSETEARLVGDSREYAATFDYYFLDGPDYRSDTWNDLYNNQVGREIGRYAVENNLTEEEVRILVEDAARTGQLARPPRPEWKQDLPEGMVLNPRQQVPTPEVEDWEAGKNDYEGWTGWPEQYRQIGDPWTPPPFDRPLEPFGGLMPVHHRLPVMSDPMFRWNSVPGSASFVAGPSPAQSSYAPGGGIGSLFYGGIANAMAGPLNGGGPFGWGVMPPAYGGGLVGQGSGAVPDYLTLGFYSGTVVEPTPGPLAVGMADETGPSWTTEDEKAEALAEAEERRREREEEKAREREEKEREREEEELRRAEKEALESARSGGSKASAGQSGSSAKRSFGSSSSANSRRTTLPSDDLSTEDWIAARNDQVHSRSSRAGRTSRR